VRLGHGSAPAAALAEVDGKEGCGPEGSTGGDPGLGAVPGPESQSRRNPGPNMVALLISISGHGPAVTTV